MRSPLFILLLSFSLNTSAQYGEWKYLFKEFYITSFAEEGNYMWIGTYCGVVKMNKASGSKTYFNKTNCPITDNIVNKIAIDKKGVKWFGTQDGGLVKYDGINWSVYDTSNSPLSDQSVQNLAIDSSNNLWVSGPLSYGGLLKFDGTNWSLYDTSNSTIPDNYIKCIYADENSVWISTQNGVAHTNGVNWKVYNVGNSNISPNYPNSISKDKSGNIWLAAYNSIEKFDGNTFTLYDNSNTNIPSNPIYSMTIDTNNIIWLGTSNINGNISGGIMSFDGNSWTKYDTINSPILGTNVYSIFADNSNNIWIGDVYNGFVDKKNGSMWTNFNLSNAQLNNPVVREIKFDSDGSPFIGTRDSDFGEGLVKYNWNNWQQIPNYNVNSYAMTTDKSGILYIKNITGLKKYDGVKWSDLQNTPLLNPYEPCFANLNAITTDSLGGIWMDYIDTITKIMVPYGGYYKYTVHEGLAHYDGIKWTVFNSLNSSFPDCEINEIKIDGNNGTWIATDKGLLKYNGTNWSHFDTSNSAIPVNFISHITFDSLNNVWFSDMQHGLIKFDGINSIQHSHPTLSHFISGSWGMETDIDGSIWQNNGMGIIRFDGNSWTTFTYENSPISSNCNTTSLSIDKFGNKWIGTSMGIFIYKNGGVVLNAPSSNITKTTTLFYPNPAMNKVTIETTINKPYNIQLFNLFGQIVYNSQQAFGNKITIDLSSLSKGVYIVEIKDEDNNFISREKLIKQ